jgi:hypothetical protein
VVKLRRGKKGEKEKGKHKRYKKTTTEMKTNKTHPISVNVCVSIYRSVRGKDVCVHVSK